MSAFDKLYEGVIPDTPVKPPRPPNPTRSSRGRTTRANSWLPDPNHPGYDTPTDIAPTSPTKLPFHDELAMAHFSPTRHSGIHNGQSMVLRSPQPVPGPGPGPGHRPVSERSTARRPGRLTLGSETNFGKNNRMTHNTDLHGRMNQAQKVLRAILPRRSIYGPPKGPARGPARGPPPNPFGDIDVDTFDMPESPGEIMELEDDMGSLPGSSMTPIHSPVSSPVRKSTKTKTKSKSKPKSKSNNKKSSGPNRSHKKGKSGPSKVKVADKADTVNKKLTVGSVGNRWSTRRRGGKSNTKTNSKTKTNARSRKGVRT